MDTAVRQADQLASAAVTGWAVVFGVLVVVVLLLAFWWGGRRARRRRMPPRDPQPGATSWHEPQRTETHHSARLHGGDDDPGS
ncbi:DUF6479 family protein [Actinacidiphila bryophytorum]|uniref:Uncharacterized protein n=1 Tax=Actinacidiphila bryophytorum TaxID=1436133 RepID=A0A9W4H3X6_9ACTN|nr:DUF6479 family protein [Actinacidiphila bryophytorum]MBM9439850.1 hypothetical protein [Actinacidiphila bryophytorum]MBN6546992.1 hypothetical protein [Actinacidiphila bryophytorum]CAG7648208.1 conserved hypothetical protein [Actinacidiphila bryophytorum]